MPKRAQAGRDLAKKFGGEVKQIYLTSGESDLLVIIDAPNGDVVAKIALAIGAQGNARTCMMRAWTEAEAVVKMISELP
ncbi:MAG: GYD domain-containing protein [Xanthobacteraceae bacterium]|nr:GYD domain-containing protein [Xanthobacteraceae bacterium]